MAKALKITPIFGLKFMGLSLCRGVHCERLSANTVQPDRPAAAEINPRREALEERRPVVAQPIDEVDLGGSPFDSVDRAQGLQAKLPIAGDAEDALQMPDGCDWARPPAVIDHDQIEADKEIIAPNRVPILLAVDRLDFRVGGIAHRLGR